MPDNSRERKKRLDPRKKVVFDTEISVPRVIQFLLNFQTMQICGAGPYDQHLMLGEHELLDHSQSLAALGIFPGALLTLKVSPLVPPESSRRSAAIGALYP